MTTSVEIKSCVTQLECCVAHDKSYPFWSLAVCQLFLISENSKRSVEFYIDFDGYKFDLNASWERLFSMPIADENLQTPSASDVVQATANICIRNSTVRLCQNSSYV